MSIARTFKISCSACSNDSLAKRDLAKTPMPPALCLPATQCSTASSPLCNVALRTGHAKRHSPERVFLDDGATVIGSELGKYTPPLSGTAWWKQEIWRVALGNRPTVSLVGMPLSHSVPLHASPDWRGSLCRSPLRCSPLVVPVFQGLLFRRQGCWWLCHW